MDLGWFEWCVLIGLVLILVECYNIRKEAANRYRIMRPMIEDWYKRNPDTQIPRD